MRLSFLIIAILFLFSCKKGTDETPNNDTGLKGKIKTITETSYSTVLINGTIQKNVQLGITKYKYNEDGNLTEQFSYFGDGRLDYRLVYFYTDKINFKAVQYGVNGQIQSNYEGKSDGNGNELESNLFEPDGTLSMRFENKYNSNNQLIERLTFDYEKAVEVQKTTCKFEYDSNGDLSKEIEYDQNEKIEYTVLYTYREYDTNKNWTIRMEKFNTDTYINERSIEYF